MYNDCMEDEYVGREYSIVPYNPEWPDRYSQIESVVQKIFAEVRSIEHVGSTSIPGMSGKDSIDVMIVVTDISIVDEKVSAMVGVGFRYTGSLLGEGTRLFRRMDGARLLANVHVFESGNYHVREMVQFRDYMRSNPEAVCEYSELKLSLYSEFPNEYSSYRKQKSAYVQPLMEMITATYENWTI